MNKIYQQVVIKVAGGVGATAFALTTINLMRGQSIGWIILLSFVAGTAGNLLLTFITTRILKFYLKRMEPPAGLPVYSFGEILESELVHAGGKGKSLARLVQAGYPVPEGVIILSTGFDRDELVPEAWERVKTFLGKTRQKYGDASFAVRSSAMAEDSTQASFAGEFESKLDQVTDEEVLTAIREVRNSRSHSRVTAYSQAKAVDAAGLDLAVVVQRMVQPDYAGVLFTMDPLSGDINTMQGNYVKGLGEKLVSGQVTASTFTFTRPKGDYGGPDGVKIIAPMLYRMASNLEWETGYPLDIEWAVKGRKIYFLQSRPISTLSGWNPDTGEWNDSLTGNFLWSGTNLTEAHPDPLTPFTISLRSYVQALGGPGITIKKFFLNGVIGGRFYSNLSVQISAFLPLFKGNAHRAYQEMAGWWGEIPADMQIPIFPFTFTEWLKYILPDLMKTIGELSKYRKGTRQFLIHNVQICTDEIKKIQAISDKKEMAELWKQEIAPYGRDSIYYVIANSADYQIRLEKELGKLVGMEEASILLSNLGGEGGALDSLGPVKSIGKVISGEMDRATYMEKYGHRGENENECAWPRPFENPQWLEQRIAEYQQAPVDVEGLISRQHQAYMQAWERFSKKYPRKVKDYEGRLKKAAMLAQLREEVRSESTRASQVVRVYAQQAGRLMGIGDDVFYLTIYEVLAQLEGRNIPLPDIEKRKQTHQRYKDLPQYPAIICGRFDPFAWAEKPDRRIDLYDSRTEGQTPVESGNHSIKGYPGAIGVVEGIARRLDHIEESAQFKQGEILVTPLTNIGWTPIFPRAAAIVTDLGAPLSHASIVARELGIPAVVGCGNATSQIKTGDHIRVDGGRGLVEILQ